MKAQMSLEFMFYIALGGLTLLAALGIAAGKEAWLSSGMRSFEISSLVAEINGGIASGAGSIEAYVPASFCNASVEGDELITQYGTFSFLEKVSIYRKSPCGGYMQMQIAYTGFGNATLVV
jgi:hypothetical protein